MITKQVLKQEEGNITSAKGFHAGGLHCGMKRKRNDLAWLYSDLPATTSAVYTTNHFQAAPLAVTKESIQTDGKIQGLLVNSGVANAVTGDQGLKNAYEMRRLFAEKLHIPETLVAINSTGLIGEQLPMPTLKKGIEAINLSKENVADFGQGILTTDTFQKHTAMELEIDGKPITIGGAAKGSGMIEPNMATMLSFITTDARVEKTALDQALKTAVNQTFNCITVDGDTSTNDTVMVMANGLAENALLTIDHKEYPTFVKGLTTVCETLAKQIARDGEGATKLIEAHVTGANTMTDARKVAKAIVGSSLVKAAIFGADANWGRIICAIGYSNVPLDPAKVDIGIGPHQVIGAGMAVPFNEEKVEAYLRDNEAIHIWANLHQGEDEGKAWGCDLTYDYVKINASYRT